MHIKIAQLSETHNAELHSVRTQLADVQQAHKEEVTSLESRLAESSDQHITALAQVQHAQVTALAEAAQEAEKASAVQLSAAKKSEQHLTEQLEESRQQLTTAHADVLRLKDENKVLTDSIERGKAESVQANAAQDKLVSLQMLHRLPYSHCSKQGYTILAIHLCAY